MKPVLKESGCVAFIVAGKELHLVIDVTHEPWKVMGEVQLAFFIKNLQEMGLGTEQLEALLSAILASNGTLH